MRALFIVLIQLFTGGLAFAQLIPIQNYSVDVNGQVRLEVNSGTDKYYLLQVKHHPDSAFTITSSITPGQAGTTVITESLAAYPIEHYQVLEYTTGSPIDFDGDG